MIDLPDCALNSANLSPEQRRAAGLPTKLNLKEAEERADAFAKSIEQLVQSGASMSLIYWRVRAFAEKQPDYAALYRTSEKWSRRWKKLAKWRGWTYSKHERTRRLYREAVEALEYVLENGLDHWSDWSHTAAENKCPRCKVDAVLAKAREVLK
jgi:superfamily I DNA/RNA helicase